MWGSVKVVIILILRSGGHYGCKVTVAEVGLIKFFNGG